MVLAVELTWTFKMRLVSCIAVSSTVSYPVCVRKGGVRWLPNWARFKVGSCSHHCQTWRYLWCLRQSSKSQDCAARKTRNCLVPRVLSHPACVASGCSSVPHRTTWAPHCLCESTWFGVRKWDHVATGKKKLEGAKLFPASPPTIIIVEELWCGGECYIPPSVWHMRVRIIQVRVYGHVI